MFKEAQEKAKKQLGSRIAINSEQGCSPFSTGFGSTASGPPDGSETTWTMKGESIIILAEAQEQARKNQLTPKLSLRMCFDAKGDRQS